MQGGPFPSRLSPGQRDAASLGLKAMIPIEPGRPFLSYILSGLVMAGFRRVGLVLAPGQQDVTAFLRAVRPSHLEVHCLIQQESQGTAAAVLAAEPFAGRDAVVVINGDNLYPAEGLGVLRQLPRAGLLGFRRSTLIRRGNIPAQRVNAFALIEADRSGVLTRIVEKPDEKETATFGENPLVSMNAWLLPPTIHAACRAIEPSPRGELELQDAVGYAMREAGERFVVVESAEGVLDLSTAADIPEVADRLRGVEIRF
jgi:dTDP-glucose pyrophosphorylase